MMISKSAKLAFGAAVAALAVSAGSADAQQVLRFSSYVPFGHFSQNAVFAPHFKDIEKATEGRVKVQRTAKPLGSPPRHYQLVVDGIADVAWPVHGYTPNVHPLSEMAELPFLTRSTEANSVAYWRVFKKHFQKAGMHKGVVTLGLNVHPAGHIYNQKRAINSFADFKGLKIRIPTSVVNEALKLLGAVPIAAPVTKLRDGLSRGIFDGTGFTDEALYNFKINKFIKYVTHIPGGMYNTSFGYVVNSKKWNKISPKDRATIRGLTGEAWSKAIGKAWDDQQRPAPARLKADGVDYFTLKGKFLTDFKAKFAFFEERWIEKANKAGVDGAAAVKMFKAEVASY